MSNLIVRTANTVADWVNERAPALAPQGLKMVGPVLMHYGTPEQKAYYLPRLL